MASVTLLSFRNQIRQRANMVNSTFVSDSELNGYINNSIAELYDILVQKYGNEYYATSSTFNLVSGTESYSLPATFFKMLGVDLLLAGNDYATLKPHMFSERNKYRQTILRGPYGGSFLRYRIQDNLIFFSPIPSTTDQIRLWFVPRPTTLSADGDTYDDINGWGEYIIVDGSIKCLQKEESDVSALMMQKQALVKRVEEAAGNRDAGFSYRIADTRKDYWGISDVYEEYP
jgi:hypothetical protein